MKKINALNALGAAIGIALTLDWFVRREESLIRQLVEGLGGA